MATLHKSEVLANSTELARGERFHPQEYPVPYKHSKSRRHKFSKPKYKYKVTNCPEYNDALRRLGDITIWFTEEAIEQWHPVKMSTASYRDGVAA